MGKIIKIKRIQKPTWGFQQTGNMQYKNTKDSVSPYYERTGAIYTGLTPEDAERLGSLLRRDLSPLSAFWIEYRVIMDERDKELDLANPEHELAYLFLLNHHRVAKSITETSPLKDYVIVDENTEAEVINEKAVAKRKANRIFDELTPAQRKDLLKLYPGFVRSDDVSDAIIEAKLYEELERNPVKFIELAEDNKKDSKVLLKDLLAAGILRKNRSSFYYGSDNLGHDEESTITYLEDPENQGLKVALMQELKKKK